MPLSLESRKLRPLACQGEGGRRVSVASGRITRELVCVCVVMPNAKMQGGKKKQKRFGGDSGSKETLLRAK